MKTLLNYLGQTRIYSIVDLAILLVAVEATSDEFFGVLCLHIGFLAYLESRHSHAGRQTVPRWLWTLFVFSGVLFYHKFEALLFLVCSYFYTKKNQKGWGVYSPLFRGSQLFFLVAGITGYRSYLPFVVFLLLSIRNAVGDMRDVEKDTKEGMKTLPVVLGMSKDLKYGHLVAVTISSLVWWSYTDLSVCVLLGLVILEIATYNLTPR